MLRTRLLLLVLAFCTSQTAWTSPNNILINGMNAAGAVPQVRLQITKSTGNPVVPGTFSFNITCTGPGGPYTGPNPVNVTLPGPAAIVGVPQGNTCTVTETAIAGWGVPVFGGSTAPIVPMGWAAQIGPMNVNTNMTVTNRPPANAPQVKLQLTKSTGNTVVPGTYIFNISCTGPGGPYTGPNPVNVTLPGSAVVVPVPQGDTCTVTETPIAGWTAPVFGGSSTPIVPMGWAAQIGPITASTSMTVTNRPPASAPQVRLQITKSTGRTVVPGTYSFNVACTGPGGPYTGSNPVNVTLPGPAVIVGVPQGNTCTVTETPLAGWGTPVFGGSSAPIVPMGWAAQIGPMNVNTTMTVTNQPPASAPQVRLQLTKSTRNTVVPGTYAFNIACTGPGGPYTGTNPVNITLPGPAAIVGVPQGDTCTVTETPIAGWGTPVFGGSSAPIVPMGWAAQIGPMNVNTTMTVTNQPPAPTTMNFQIQKQFQAAAVPGTYTFNISCTGAYTGPGVVSLTVPPSPSSTSIPVPVGSTCTLTENPIPGWNAPLFGGSGQPVNPNLNWGATIGPINPNNNMSDRVQVTNGLNPGRRQAPSGEAEGRAQLFTDAPFAFGVLGN